MSSPAQNAAAVTSPRVPPVSSRGALSGTGSRSAAASRSFADILNLLSLGNLIATPAPQRFQVAAADSVTCEPSGNSQPPAGQVKPAKGAPWLVEKGPAKGQIAVDLPWPVLPVILFPTSESAAADPAAKAGDGSPTGAQGETRTAAITPEKTGTNDAAFIGWTNLNGPFPQMKSTSEAAKCPPVGSTQGSEADDTKTPTLPALNAQSIPDASSGSQLNVRVADMRYLLRAISTAAPEEEADLRQVASPAVSTHKAGASSAASDRYPENHATSIARVFSIRTASEYASGEVLTEGDAVRALTGSDVATRGAFTVRAGGANSPLNSHWQDVVSTKDSAAIAPGATDVKPEILQAKHDDPQPNQGPQPGGAMRGSDKDGQFTSGNQSAEFMKRAQADVFRRVPDAAGITVNAGDAPGQPHPLPEQPLAAAATLQVAQDIVRHIKVMTQEGKTEVNLKLEPESMGPVTLRVSSEDGKISADLGVKTQEARTYLEASVPQIKQSLEGSGLSLSHIAVNVSGGESRPGQPRYNGRRSNQRVAAETESGLDESARSFGYNTMEIKI